MNIFVTGGTGFIGSHFVNAANKAGHAVFALKRQSSEPVVAVDDNIKWIIGSLEHIDYKIFDRIDVLVHLASYGVSPKPADWDNCIMVNCYQSSNLIQMAYRHGVRKFLITGTFAEYGYSGYKYDFIPPDAPLDPIGPYPTSKVMYYKLLRGYYNQHTDNHIFYGRLFSVFGDGQFEDNFFPQLKNAALAGKDFKMTQGEQIRDFIEVSEVCNKLIAAINNMESKGFITKNIASGDPTTLINFAQNRWKKWNAKGNLLVGALPYRENEVMRYVPEL